MDATSGDRSGRPRLGSIGSLLSSVESADGKSPHQAPFLLAFPSDSDASAITQEISSERLPSTSASYCQMGCLSTENSNILMVCETEGGKISPDLSTANSGNRAFECPFCHREFRYRSALKMHTRCHTGKPYQCMICGRAFAQKLNVKKHIERHKIYPHAAVRRGKENSTTVVTDFQGEGRIVLEQLDQTSAAVVERRDKCDVSAFLGTAYRCPYCRNLLHCHLCMRKHMLTHKDKKMFQCPVPGCRGLVQKLEDFLVHLGSHNGLAYECPICCRSYSSLLDVGIHQCTHVLLNEKRPCVKKSCRCLACGDEFRSLESLERHYAQSYHNHRCMRCNRVYASARRLRKHLKSHQVGQKVDCRECNKTFAVAWTLKCHQKNVHGEGSGSFCCSVCKKKFKRRDVLRRHEATVHNATATYSCTFEGCNKAFKRQDQLKEHVLRHSDIKKHQCKVCNKSFVRLQTYKLHVSAVHEKTYKFSCEGCQKGFNRPDKYQNHKMKCNVKPN